MTNGTFNITVKAKDIHNAESDWSNAKTVTIADVEPQTNLSIEVKGGFGARAFIKNSGDEDFTGVEWSITVKGVREIKQISEKKTGTSNIEAGQQLITKTAVRGFGRVKITAIAKYGDQESIEETADAFVIGPLVILSKS